MSEPTRRAPREVEARRNDAALLSAARAVIAADGPRASVAAIARRAGVGIGSLYRRYRTKEELFQRLCEIASDEYRVAAEEGLAHDDPWAGLAHYLASAIAIGPGSLAPIAGAITVTPEMTARSDRADAAVEGLVARARTAGVLRPDVTDVDLALLVEQLASSPVTEQLARQGQDELIAAAGRAKTRVIAIAIDGLRNTAVDPLPGPAPSKDLFTRRWTSRGDADPAPPAPASGRRAAAPG